MPPRTTATPRSSRAPPREASTVTPIRTPGCGPRRWRRRGSGSDSSRGGVCHTINPRLFPEQIVYIVNHAEDQLLFVDLNLLPAVEKLQGQFKTVRHIVAMTDRAHLPKDVHIPDLLVYEDLIADKPGSYEWPVF